MMSKRAHQMLPTISKAHLSYVVVLVAASFVARCYLPSHPTALLHMRTGESQFHSRLAQRLLDDGPFSYSAWVDKLSMHPSGHQHGASQPPGTLALAAAAVRLERLFSGSSSSSLVFIAPVVHVIFTALM
jgi:hypothetical protein